jgi:topoisomerase-4 subunit A
VILQRLDAGDKLVDAVPIGERGVIVSGTGRSGKEATVLLSAGALQAHLGKRASKGKKLAARLKAERLLLPPAKSSPTS